VNWDELVMGWSVGDVTSTEGASGSVIVKEFFSDFPEDLEMTVKLEQRRSQRLSLNVSKVRVVAGPDL
jgi:hypothetical protein